MIMNKQRLIVSVIGRKGGAGKTTTTLNVAGAFGEAGHRVTLIDLDPQSSLARLVEDVLGPGTTVQDLGPQAEAHATRGDIVPWLRAQLPATGVVVIDTPPHLGLILDAAVAVADRVLLPTRLAQQDIDSLLDTLDRCPSGALIVANAVSRYRVHQDALSALRDAYDGQVWTREIPESVVILEACNAGLPVVRYKKRSAPAAAYRALAAAVLAP